MRISYLNNSSIPSRNPASIQVAKTCEAIISLSNKVNLIVPYTGLKESLKNYYGLKFTPNVIKVKFFKSFPRGIKYYLFSVLSVIYGIFLKTTTKKTINTKLINDFSLSLNSLEIIKNIEVINEKTILITINNNKIQFLAILYLFE